MKWSPMILFLLYVDVHTHTVHFSFILHTALQHTLNQKKRYCMFTLGCLARLAVKVWFRGLFHRIDATYLALTTEVFASRIDNVSSLVLLRRTCWHSGCFVTVHHLTALQSFECFSIWYSLHILLAAGAIVNDALYFISASALGWWYKKGSHGQ